MCTIYGTRGTYARVRLAVSNKTLCLTVFTVSPIRGCDQLDVALRRTLTLQHRRLHPLVSEDSLSSTLVLAFHPAAKQLLNLYCLSPALSPPISCVVDNTPSRKSSQAHHHPSTCSPDLPRSLPLSTSVTASPNSLVSTQPTNLDPTIVTQVKTPSKPRSCEVVDPELRFIFSEGSMVGVEAPEAKTSTPPRPLHALHCTSRTQPQIDPYTECRFFGSLLASSSGLRCELQRVVTQVLPVI